MAEDREQKSRRWREGPELGLVGLGVFCSEADGDPQEGFGQRGNMVRFAFLIQQFGCCVKR